MSALLLLSLILPSSGCVTTTEKKVVIRNENVDPAPPLPPVKESAKEALPPRTLTAFAELKEKEADAAQDSPEKQAHLRNEARLSYQELIKTEPDNVAGYRGLARVYMKLNDYARATETFKKALAKHPRDLNLWTELGMMHNCRKEWTTAIQCFRKALEIDPENQANLKALGFTLARAGQVEQSVVYLTRAMGSPAAAHYSVAQMLLHLADLEPATRNWREERARDHLRLALQENPNYERAREQLAMLDATTSDRGTAKVKFLEPGH